MAMMDPIPHFHEEEENDTPILARIFFIHRYCFFDVLYMTLGFVMTPNTLLGCIEYLGIIIVGAIITATFRHLYQVCECYE